MVFEELLKESLADIGACNIIDVCPHKTQDLMSEETTMDTRSHLTEGLIAELGRRSCHGVRFNISDHIGADTCGSPR